MKKTIKNIIEKGKEIINDIIIIVFWFYIFFSVLIITFDLLHGNEPIDGIIAIIVIVYGLYIYWKKHENKKDES